MLGRNRSHEEVQHFPYSVITCPAFLELLPGQKPQISSEMQKIAYFRERSSRKPAEVKILLGRTAGIPFGNVGGNGNGGPPELCGQAKLLGSWECSAEFIQFQGH